MNTKEENITFSFNADVNLDKPMFPISVIANVLKVHQRTLRIYDEEEILSPSRSDKNRRLYSLNDIELGKAIQYFTKELGINLNGIKIIFNLLEKQGVPLDKYINYIANIANEINITPEMQKENRERLSRRGRKPKNKN